MNISTISGLIRLAVIPENQPGSVLLKPDTITVDVTKITIKSETDGIRRVIFSDSLPFSSTPATTLPANLINGDMHLRRIFPALAAPSTRSADGRGTTGDGSGRRNDGH